MQKINLEEFKSYCVSSQSSKLSLTTANVPLLSYTTRCLSLKNEYSSTFFIEMV